MRKILATTIFQIAQECLKSYLKDRKLFVQIDECASTLLNVTCGVPQGSILGPKLFILYINDICNASTSLKFILFADDTNVFYSGVDIQTVTLRNPDIITTLIVTLNTPYNYDHVRFFILRVPTPDHGNTRTDDVINMLGTDHYL